MTPACPCYSSVIPAAMVVYGYDSTVPITVDDLIPLTRAVVRGSSRAMVVADLPFGSYQDGPSQALATATRFMKEAGPTRSNSRVANASCRRWRRWWPPVPVMGHLGLTLSRCTPSAATACRVVVKQGQILMRDAKNLQAAGAFAVVLEVVPHELADAVTRSLAIPTIGIGAGASTDAQVLVWQDLAGLTLAHRPSSSSSTRICAAI